MAIPQNLVVGLGVCVRPALEDEKKLVGEARILGRGFQGVEEVDCVVLEAMADMESGLGDAFDEPCVVPDAAFGVEVGQGGGRRGEEDGKRD